jgi:YHS domain-containing protein
MKQYLIPSTLLLLSLFGAMFSHAAPAAADKSSYPLSICVISGDQLGAMGAPTTIQYHGTDVRFCCKDCEKEFQKDPDKYLKRLEQAQQKASK